MRSILFFCFCFVFQQIFCQKTTTNAAQADLYDTAILNQIHFRNIGPWRGGRSTAVIGDFTNKQLYYFGSTGGGVWKTIDGGNEWESISDGFFGGSIGSIALSKSDPTILYVGAGENTMRGNVSEGFGMWKSENGGRTWKNIGLNDTRHIMRIAVHPKNPNIVYCAALGHLFGPNKERGIYRTKDGGASWEKILYVNDQVGACDLILDPTDPNILLATFWNVKRTPFSLESGGVGSGIYKSADGGDSWKNLTTNKGLPKDTLGIIGITIAPSNPNIYYSIIESKNGGVYKSENAGLSWEKINSDNNLKQRAWYFSKIYCDPKNENTVYVLNVEFWKSVDGGKNFTSISTPHGDHHDLWIDPEDPQRMIIADDGGAQITLNGGINWSSYYNQPTAQIYRVSTDNYVPYRILGAQQDNSSLRIFHRSKDGQIDENDWEPTAGFESGYIVADPVNPNIVYGGNYSGFIGCYNHTTNDMRNITVWPNDPIGQGADIQKYRFQWNFPIFFSPHDPKKLYAAGNILFYTLDGGTNWISISPDLTTNDKTKQKPSGGIITKDNTGVEVYCTIFSAAESPLEKDLIYTGSDDGLIFVTQNGGKNWENITPKDLPKDMLINCIEIDPFQKGKMYFAGTKYKSDDYAPYLFVTSDYGKSWNKIVNGINKEHFTRVIRADKKRQGLLYAGTEYGLYISYDDGKNWISFQNNLPIVPITDMTIKNNDLILSTQGRGFWIIDDVSLLQDMQKGLSQKEYYVYEIRKTYLIDGYQNERPINGGINPKPGVVIQYYLKNDPDTMPIEIMIYDNKDSLIQKFSTLHIEKDFQFIANEGLNQFSWDMFYPSAKKIDGQFLWNGVPGKYRAAPGEYTAKIKFNKSDSVIKYFTLLPDPNSAATYQDYLSQFIFLNQIVEKFNETQNALSSITAIQLQLNNYINKAGEKAPSSLKDSVQSVNKKLKIIEETLYETNNKSVQDMLNYGIKLNDKLAGVFNAASMGNFEPSQQMYAVYDFLVKEIDLQLEKLKTIKEVDIKEINKLIATHQLPAILVD